AHATDSQRANADPSRVAVPAPSSAPAANTPADLAAAASAHAMPDASLHIEAPAGRIAHDDKAQGFVRCIVIDPGHGGHDTGTIGSGGLREKDLVLDVARRLRDYIAKNYPDIEVLLTRDSDRFIALEERTAIANSKRADLFISIHANSSPSKVASGVE